VDAVHLIDRHLPSPELRGGERFPKIPNHQVAIELLLLWKAGGIDGRELRQENAILREVPVYRRLRQVAELVVIALVAEYGRELGSSAEVVFPLVVKQYVQRFDARLDGW